MTPLSQKCGEKQGRAFEVGPYLSFLKPFQYEETKHLALALEKNCSFTFLCILN